MITNVQELRVTQERIARLQRLLLQLRSTARPAEFQALASGYRLEIERMEAEQPPSDSGLESVSRWGHPT